MIAAVLAAATTAFGSFEPVAFEDPEPALAALGPQQAGATAVTAWVGTPLHGVRIDHGLAGIVDVGLTVETWPGRFWRPSLQARVRALRTGPLQLLFRGTVGRALTTSSILIPTSDGELALQLGYAVLPRLAATIEGSFLGSTDFTREHTAGFVQARGGLSFAPPGPFALIAAVGVLRGSRGSRAVGTGGATFRF